MWEVEKIFKTIEVITSDRRIVTLKVNKNPTQKELDNAIRIIQENRNYTIKQDKYPEYWTFIIFSLFVIFILIILKTLKTKKHVL